MCHKVARSTRNSECIEASAAVMKSLSLRALPFPSVRSIRRYQPTGSLSSVRSQQEQKSLTLQRRVLVLCQHSDHQNHSDSLLVTECLPGCPVAKGKRERLPTYPNLVMNGATLSGSPTKHRASSLIMICNAPHLHSRAEPTIARLTSSAASPAQESSAAYDIETGST